MLADILRPLSRAILRVLQRALPFKHGPAGKIVLRHLRKNHAEIDLAIAEGSEPDRDHDLAQDFFPAESERMGTRADAMALGSLLIGLAAVAASISRELRPCP